MEITLQYFEGCPHRTVAAEHLARLAANDVSITIKEQVIQSPEDAEAARFRGSPSILIDGSDAFPDTAAEVGFACRVYATPAGLAGSPTLEQLRGVIAERRGSAS